MLSDTVPAIGRQPMVGISRFGTVPYPLRYLLTTSVVDPKLFFSDPDPTFQEISAPDPISDPT